DHARVGESIGAFRLLRLIGTGGMGAVYLAERKVDNFVHRVALKIVRGEGVSAAARERFERERQILANLVHPNIGILFEGGQTDDGQPYYTMEYVDGVAITDYCRDHALDVDQRIRLLIDVASALSHAHQNLIVHRDIKPSNILVTTEGRAKLLDFGIAKRVGGSEESATHGAFGPMTPEYAAPEQFRNAPITVATDVYQFGVLCFRVLTGSRPYRVDASDGAAWARAVTTAEPTLLPRALDASDASRAWKQPTNILRVKRQLGGDLDAVVRKMLAKEPSQRYHSMDALIADLRAVLSGRPVSAQRAGALYFARRFVARRPLAVATAVLTALALIAATTISILAARRAEQEAHRAEVTNKFLISALDLTDRFSSNNRGDSTLADVLERAVVQADTELKNEPDLRADVLTQLSRGLQNRGKLVAAIAAAREALDIRSAMPGAATAVQRAASSQQLASVEIENGNLDEATAHLEATLRDLVSAGDQDAALIRAYTSLGKLTSMRGDADGSLRWYQKVLSLREGLSGDHAADLAMDYSNLGTGLYNLSRFAEANDAYVRGIDLLKKTFGDDHPRIGFVRYGQVLTLTQLGRFDEARATAVASQASLEKGVTPGTVNPGSVNIDRALALLDYLTSDYASALRHVDAAIAQTRSASPVSLAGTLVLRGRIELAQGHADRAADTFAESERLFVQNGRDSHGQRWYAAGLNGVARARIGDVAAGDAALDNALAKLGADGMHVGFEQADLALYAGAAARRRGDVGRALTLHRLAAELQKRIGWLGELGQAWVDAELSEDGQHPDADVEAREQSARRAQNSRAILQRIAPHDPRLSDLATTP
ncbi:MAG: serine/threonine-protein kinase, partial [Dokdonella sp.]|uniref:serine/threonine-protein kinase n=1 Tax=Dokdonella sp. TaxID=2291710 RepID=UPI00326732E5